MVTLNDNRVLVQTSKKDHTPAIFIFRLDNPETRNEVKRTASSGLSSLKTNSTGYVAISEISAVKSSGKRNLFGKSKFRQVVTTSTFTHLTVSTLSFATNENFGIYKVADGGKVWNQAGVKRFSLTKKHNRTLQERWDRNLGNDPISR